MAEDVPQAIAEGSITISGRTIRTAVLDNGMRLLHGEDLWALLAAWSCGEAPAATPEEAAQLKAFAAGDADFAARLGSEFGAG